MKWQLIILLLINIGAGAQVRQPVNHKIKRTSAADTFINRIRIRPAAFQQRLPPIANAGPDQSIILPSKGVTLNGSGTARTPNGSIVNYRWAQVSGPSKCDILAPASSQTEIRNLQPGSYQFALRVMDNREGMAWDTTIVNVRTAPPRKNLPPVANAGPDKTVTLPVNSVMLTGSGTDPDPNGYIASYQWSQVSGPAQSDIAQPGNSKTRVNNLAQGTYEFELRVYDNVQAFGTDLVQVRVRPAAVHINHPPIANAGPDQTITLPVNSVTLEGSGTDPDRNGFITGYRWRQISGPTRSDIAQNRSSQTRINNLAEGVYQFELTVTDNERGAGTAIVTVTVNTMTPPPSTGSSGIPPLLIVAGIIGLGGLGYATYHIFGIITRPKKILAFFVHKDEEELVDLLMPGSEKTEGFAVGHCRSAKIKKLRDKGIAIQVLNTYELSVNTPGITRTYKYSFKKGGFKLKSITRMQEPGDVNFKNILLAPLAEPVYDFPAYYIITLDVPLLPVYKERLTGFGIVILQYVPHNSYIILVKNERQLNELQHADEFKFIRLINPYTSLETGFIVRVDRYRDALRPGQEKELVLDLILHREDDVPEVLNFLRQKEIEIIADYKNNIRIRIQVGSSLEYDLASNKYIQAIYEYVPPVLNNDVARQLIGIDSGAPGATNISENGEGEIIGVADTGIDSKHPDLKAHIIDMVSLGRKATNDTSDPVGHGTHVAGTIVGDGIASNGQVKGIAPGAKIFFQSLIDDKGSLAGLELGLEDLFLQAYAKGARIHNNSWGSSTESRYTPYAAAVDNFVHEHPEMLIVVSAGNDGTGTARAEKGYVGISSIGSPATTKNGITVGASRNKRTTGGYASSTYGKIWPEKFPDAPTCNEPVSGDPDSVAAFSSRGPCDDHRMKPDIVAPGTDILSTKSSLSPLNQFIGGYQNQAYAFMVGTSMAAPMVSGAAAIIREFYRKKRLYATPSAALIKATLLNGTRKLTGESAVHGNQFIPNPNQGYGMLDLLYTIPNEKNNFLLEFRDSYGDPGIAFNTTGQVFTLKLTTTKVSWIRVCLVYTDYPGRGTQQDLDLVIGLDETRVKWTGNIGINGKEVYPTLEDRSNNIEVIRIDTAEPGNYTIKVYAYSLYKGKQGFALVVTTSDLSGKFS
jgi:serine protease AprX